jgi:uncharacterized protein YndB with AHSA1/START domain
MSAATYEFKINAPLEAVWVALTTLQEYERWNPFIIRAAGTMDPGTDLELVCFLQSGKDLRGAAEVTSYEPNRRVSWEMGSAFKTWTVRMEVHSTDEQTTELTVVTEMKSMPRIGRAPGMDDIEDGFKRMADALNKHVAELASPV